jgi:hypothetical protein
MKPPLTPLEVIETYPDHHRRYTVSDMMIYYDGPQNSPPELWSPIIVYADGRTFYASGDIGDEITGYTEWIEP